MWYAEEKLKVFDRGPDCYHTCYVLSGLSAAQHKLSYSPVELSKISPTRKPFRGKNESPEQASERESAMYASLMGWKATPATLVGLESNRLVRVLLLLVVL